MRETGLRTAPSPLESLRRVLLLEQEKGYTDRVVMGGLDRFWCQWRERAAEQATHPALWRRLQALTPGKQGYAALSQHEREQWLSQVLSLLAEMEGPDGGPTRSAPPARPSGRKPGAKAIAKLGLNDPAVALKGVSSGIADKLAKLGVKTVRDLLYFFPRRYLDYSQRRPIAQLEIGQEQTVVAVVWEARGTTLGQRRSAEAILGDETGNVRAVWFNQPYIAKSLPTNAQVVISGKVTLFKGRKVFESPEWELVEEGETIHTGRLVPLYHLTEGLSPRRLRRLMKEVVDNYAPQLTEFLPPPVLQGSGVMALEQAVGQIHFPDSWSLQEQGRKRLAFDELFLMQLGLLSRKRAWQEGPPSPTLTPHPDVLEAFFHSLPFTLTGAQQQALREILGDMAQPRAMCRLLQGEVGSGKTVVATAALLIAAANGYQGALMAPTEILAEQHFQTLGRLLGGKEEPAGGAGLLRLATGLLPRPLTVGLLIGSLSQAEKVQLHQLIAAGEVDIVLGTHALIQGEVEFARLGLAAVDEQHRFGVMQRSALRRKGYNPHLLVMTATPIPRSLALTFYGDLDLSVIAELPPGRAKVKTRWLGPERRDTAYAFLRQRIAQGEQGFIVCPLIEESENIQTRAAVAEYERLSREVFPDLRLGLLHGKMAAAEKEAVMRRFREGGIEILVSTPVVEVGIDVPNATVMLVDGAERFGLAQLHQFRGRVGRGEQTSYCILLAENPSPEAQSRLSAVEKEGNGFILAEKDLELRGPGEFFGTRQSGLPELRLARLSDASGLLELAREQARRLLELDPQLSRPEHGPLSAEVRLRWPQSAEMELRKG